MSAQTKTPKKTIRRSARGNIIAYVGREVWMNFGDWFDPHAQRIAQVWLETFDVAGS